MLLIVGWCRWRDRSPRADLGAAFPVEVLLLGRSVRLAGAPQRVVLARLAISAGRIVSSLELIDALWPTQPSDNAVGNLHNYVSRLRRAVGEGPVTREPGGYRLVVAPEAVDVGGVEQRVPGPLPRPTPPMRRGCWRKP